MELNLNYLINKVSRRLHTVVRIIDSSYKPVSKVCLRMDLDDTELFNTLLEHSIIQNYLDENSFIPTIFSVNKEFIYGLVKQDFSTLIVGPIKYSDSYSLKNSCNISLEKNEFNTVSKILEPIDWNEVIDCFLDLINLSLVSEMRTEITEADIINFNCLSSDFNYQIRRDLEQTIFEKQETGAHHNPYDQEIRELSAIENGDIEALRKSLSEDYTGQIGILAEDSLRSTKNIAIIVIAIASRAAIKGGLSPEIAFSMSDIYIKQIEEISSESIALQITRNAEYEFTKIVHDIKMEQTAMNTFSGKENEHVMAAKNYIFKHLHGKVTVAEIAEALGLNANYLSGLFRKNEGITLTDYILSNKITLVKNLLTYSAYNYSEISYYLGFASQSHLGKIFKEKTGMTLSQYRTKYQMQEFLD